MKKKMLIVVAALVVSVGFNLWFFGFKAWEAYELRIRLEGANEAILAVAAFAVRNKEVTIKTTNGDITLVLKETEREIEIPDIAIDANGIPD